MRSNQKELVHEASTLFKSKLPHSVPREILRSTHFWNSVLNDYYAQTVN